MSKNKNYDHLYIYDGVGINGILLASLKFFEG